MAKQGAKTATPRLRFSEFRKAEPWLVKELSTLANRVAIKNASGRVTRVLTNSAEFGVLDQRDYFEKDIATAGQTDGYYVVEKGDYVYNPRTSALAPVGPISRNDIGEGVMSPLYTVFRFAARQTDFYRHYFQSTGWHAYLRSAASTGARHDRMSITNDAFMRMPLPVPELAEQRRIADCLTSLDEVIAAQGRKVEALKAHKRGLMQQLFPREGETRPRLRFPEFRNAPEWSVVDLGELLESKPEYGVNAPAVPFSTELPAYLRITDIDDAGRYMSEGKVSVAIDAKPEHYLGIGDIALARTGASVGKSYLYREEDGPLVFAGFLIRLRPNKEKVVPSFVFGFLRSQQYWEWVHVTSARSGQPGINGSEYATLPIPLPPFGDEGKELAEQQRIADCLSSLDARIATEITQLDALRFHKQGLMQQLFPAPAAVGA